jgi:hypothetical protein
MKPGDKLYFVRNYNHTRNQPLTVSKVGRLWVYFEERPRWKMDRKTWHVFQEDYLLGHCYESEQAYRDRLLVRHEISRFRRLVDEAELTDLASVRRAAEILGLEL